LILASVKWASKFVLWLFITIPLAIAMNRQRSGRTESHPVTLQSFRKSLQGIINNSHKRMRSTTRGIAKFWKFKTPCPMSFPLFVTRNRSWIEEERKRNWKTAQLPASRHCQIAVITIKKWNVSARAETWRRICVYHIEKKNNNLKKKKRSESTGRDRRPESTRCRDTKAPNRNLTQQTERERERERKKTHKNWREK